MKRLPASVFIDVAGVPSIPVSGSRLPYPKAKRTASSSVPPTALQAPLEGLFTATFRQGPPQSKA